jgi:hypothetical protein
MNKEFIPYEQALELKDLGFDEPCLAVYRGGSLYGSGTSVSGYYEDGHWQLEKNSDYGGDKKQWVSATTYSQSFRWFREKYKIGYWIHHYYDMDKGLFIYSYVLTLPYRSDEYVYDTHEEAELQCLKKLINIVKNN